MNKDRIVEGQEYARYSDREFNWYAGRVRVVSNKTYFGIRMRSLAREELAKNPTYVAAHLKSSLTEAYANYTSPNEASEARRGLRETVHTATREWYDAEPMRGYRQTDSKSNEGILVMRLDREGHDQHLALCPRREIRDTWTDHQAKVQKAQTDRVEAENARAERQVRIQGQREVVYSALAAAFTQAGVKPPYLSSYADHVSLTFPQAAALLGVSLDEEVNA